MSVSPCNLNNSSIGTVSERGNRSSDFRVSKIVSALMLLSEKNFLSIGKVLSVESIYDYCNYCNYILFAKLILL